MANTLTEKQPVELPSAVDLFEGKERACKYVIDAIRESRVKANLRPHELGALAGLEDPKLVYHLEAGEIPLDLGVIQALMAALELPIDSALPDPQLTPEQRKKWFRLLNLTGGGFGAGGGLDSEVALSVFVRLKALQEICA